MAASARGLLAGITLAIAGALVVIALAIVAFLNPVWVGFEQGRSQVTAWTGWPESTIAPITDSILHDLVIGPPDFAVTLNGTPVLNDRERQHMRDVRRVFAALYVAAAAGLAVIAAAFVMTRRRGRRTLWRYLGRVGIAIAGVTVVGGAIALVSFDAAFEAFHEVFFPAGTFLFDPRTDRLVQLFPDQFWVETSTAVGIVIVILGALLAVVARRRAARPGGSQMETA